MEALPSASGKWRKQEWLQADAVWEGSVSEAHLSVVVLCEVWALDSFSDRSHSAGRCPHPWSGFAWETLRGAGVGWAKLQSMKGLM